MERGALAVGEVEKGHRRYKKLVGGFGKTGYKRNGG